MINADSADRFMKTTVKEVSNRERQSTIPDLTLGPLLFQPILKQACWGGDRLGIDLSKSIGPENDYAESWELVDLPHQQSLVVNGPFAGWFLDQVCQNYSTELYGSQRQFERFPLLIKYLDVQNRLSIQVHPNDGQAFELAGGVGKTETWIVMDSTPESRVYVGLKKPVSQTEFEHLLSEGGVEECLHSFKVSPGDVIHIPAGTVHAVSGSVLLAEVQQASELSYRLSDWDRHLQGEIKRELHLEEALYCLDYAQGPVEPVAPEAFCEVATHYSEKLVNCDYYAIHRHRVKSQFELPIDDQFKIVMLLEGCGTMTTGGEMYEIEKGQTWLIPASATSLQIVPEEEITLLEVFVP